MFVFSLPFQQKVEHRQRLNKTFISKVTILVVFFFHLYILTETTKKRYSTFKIQNFTENAYLHISRLKLS